MENLKSIAGFLTIISGIVCTVSILICLIKMLTTEDSSTYKSKIKNSLIALVLISSICVFINVFGNYFNTSEMGIGKTNKEIGMLGDSSLVSDKDIQEREIVVINNIKYVVTDRNVKLHKRTGDGKILQGVGTPPNDQYLGEYDILRLYSESQDFYKGYFAEKKFYRKHTDELESKYNQNKSNVKAYCTFNKSIDTSDNAGSLISPDGSNIDSN